MECCNCGADFELSELTEIGGEFACFSCKVAVISRMNQSARESAAKKIVIVEDDTSEAYEYVDCGGFFIRLLARLIDSIPVGILFFGVTVVFCFFYFGGIVSPFEFNQAMQMDIHFMLLYGLVSFFVGGVYEASFTSWFGGTPGKLIFGLRVVCDEYKKISFSRALFRYFLYSGQPFTSMSFVLRPFGLYCLSSFIKAAVDDDKRALHDLFAGTRVIKI